MRAMFSLPRFGLRFLSANEPFGRLLPRFWKTMRDFPFFWQHGAGGDGSSRFFLSAPEETLLETRWESAAPAFSPGDNDDPGDEPLESLRADVIIALSNRLTTTSIEHPHLASFLMDGLDNALERLAISPQQHELSEVQQWLWREQIPDLASLAENF